ncbi:hypothetical protein DVH05_020226 [Phytophthora capsici]|nr:hypothetical protein DVH05_020226 [Phytophthora capsici]
MVRRFLQIKHAVKHVEELMGNIELRWGVNTAFAFEKSRSQTLLVGETWNCNCS